MYKNKTASHFKPLGQNRKDRTNKNEFIRATEILVIDSEGNNLGQLKTTDALKMALEQELDLVEINPHSTPPVCKIMDYSKYLYEQKKKEKKNKATKAKEVKELRFSPVIQEHDIEVRVKKAEKFLNKGHNIKLTILRKGRQTREQAKEVMERLLTIFADYSTIEPEPKEEGRKLSITIKSHGKAKNQKDSNKKDKIEQPQREKGEEDHVQEERTTPSKDKIIQKIKEKEAAKRNSS